MKTLLLLEVLAVFRGYCVILEELVALEVFIMFKGSCSIKSPYSRNINKNFVILRSEVT